MGFCVESAGEREGHRARGVPAAVMGICTTMSCRTQKMPLDVQGIRRTIIRSGSCFRADEQVLSPLGQELPATRKDVFAFRSGVLGWSWPTST